MLMGINQEPRDKCGCKEESFIAWEKDPPTCLCSSAIHTSPASSDCKSPAHFSSQAKASE